MVGKFLRRNEIAADDVERIKLQLHRDALHQPLQRQIKLRAAKAPDETRRHFVGEHDAIDHLDIGNVVGASHGAVHAVERPRHRRAQECAVIFELIELQPEDAAVLGDRRLDFGNAVRAGACGDQVLDAVLGPFHRPASDARRERDQHHIRKNRKFNAETAAGIGRDAQAQFRAGDAQRARHHRMHAERALEIRQHIVAAFGGIVLGDHHVAFDRRERQPREFRGHGDAAIRAREGGFGVAVGKLAHRDFVGLGLRMKERRGLIARGTRIDDRFARRVFDHHQFGGIFGDIAALGHDQRHRLANIAHALHGQRPLLHRRFHRGEKRLREFAHLFAGDDGPDAVVRERSPRVDRKDVGVRVGRADDVGVQGADRHRQIVGIAAAARQQRRVLLAQGLFCAFGHR